MYFLLIKAVILLRILKKLIMKKLLYYSLTLLLTFTACQVDNEDLFEDLSNADLELNISPENVTSNATDLNNQAFNSRGFDETNVFEINMQWVSFITAQAIRRDAQAKQDFLNRIGLNKAINLDTLLGQSVPDTSPFKFRFSQLLQYYIENPQGGCRPGASAGRPPGNGPGSDIPNDDPGIVDPTTIFPDRSTELNNLTSDLSVFDGILKFECLEIFVPQQINFFSDVSNLVSTAHPLNNNSLANYGYWVHGERTLNGCFEPIGATYVNNVNPIYLNVVGYPVIVARPVRTDTCLYRSYPNIDFTNFLDI